MDIVVTGYAGLDGSRKIYHHMEYRRKLLMKYSECFFGVLESGSREASGGGSEGDSPLERRFQRERDKGLAAAAAMDGGVLAALWQLLKGRRLGGTYDLSKIPVLQQTIEVCEMFELNPYRLYAPSCRVWLAEEPGEILSDAAGAGVPFAVIGYTAGGAAIRRTDTDVPSSLRRPEGDELYRLSGFREDQSLNCRK